MQVFWVTYCQRYGTAPTVLRQWVLQGATHAGLLGDLLPLVWHGPYSVKAMGATGCYTCRSFG